MLWTVIFTSTLRLLEVAGMSEGSANQTLAKRVAYAFSGVSRTRRNWDAEECSYVDLLTTYDYPRRGVTSYSTVGLSGWPLIINEREHEARLEIVGACGSDSTDFHRALVTSAFCIINSKWSCFPGQIFPDVLSMYNASSTMSHFLFTPPFLWKGLNESIEVEGRKVVWLMAVPVSEAELQVGKNYAEKRPSDVLVDELERQQVDVCDLARPSIF